MLENLLENITKFKENISQSMSGYTAERRLVDANSRLDYISREYSGLKAAAMTSASPVARVRGLSQEDTIDLAADEENLAIRLKKMARQQFMEGLYSGTTPLRVSAIAVACGAAVLAGVGLGIAIPTLSPALAAFGFAFGAYNASALLGGQSPGHLRMAAVSAGIGLVAGAINLIPGSAPFYIGGAMAAAGVLGVYLTMSTRNR